MEQTATNAAPSAPPSEPRPIVKTAPKSYWKPKASKAKATLLAKQSDVPASAKASVEPSKAPLVAPSGRKVGRPSSKCKLTPEVRQRVLEGISSGLTIDKAAIRAGVGSRSVVRWREQFPDFLEECRVAETEAEIALLASLKRKGEGGNKLWTADAWMLERRYGWQAVSRQEHTGANGGPIQHLTIAKHLLARVGNAGDRAKAEPKRAEVVDV